MKSFYINPSGEIRVIIEMPEEPKRDYSDRHVTEFLFKIAYREYQQALAAAKDSAVPFADQAQAHELLDYVYNNTYVLKPNTLHPFPSEGYYVEIHERDINVPGDSIKSAVIKKKPFIEPCKHFYDEECECKIECVMKADEESGMYKEPNHEESQEELWDHAQLIVKEKLGTYSNDLVCDLARWAVEALKERFTIARKA